MIGYGYFSYESKLDRFIEREARAASGMGWQEAAPVMTNPVLFSSRVYFGNAFSVFRIERRPFPAAALLVMTGAAADRMVEIADKVTDGWWMETFPDEIDGLVRCFDACMKTGIRIKEAVDPIRGRREFEDVAEAIAVNTADRKYSVEDLRNAVRSAREGMHLPPSELTGFPDEDFGGRAAGICP